MHCSMLHPHAHTHRCAVTCRSPLATFFLLHTFPGCSQNISYISFLAFFDGLQQFWKLSASGYTALPLLLLPCLTAKAARHTHKCLWQQLPTSSSTSPVLNNARVLHNLCFLAGRIEKYIQTKYTRVVRRTGCNYDYSRKDFPIS